MNPHLSSEEIAQWTLGEYSSEVEQHLSDCSACRAELGLFKVTLSSFRESAHAWADQQCGPDDQTIRRIRQAPYRSALSKISLVAVVGLVCLLAVLSAERQQKTTNFAESKIDDAVLLQSVKQDLSDTLPTSLAPLRGVVSWEATDTGVRR